MLDRSGRFRLRLATIAAGVLILLMTPSFGQFLPRPPRDPRPEQARLAFEAGRYEESAELLEEYVRGQPDNAEAWLFLAWSRYRLGEFSVSLQHFERSLEEDPASIDALVGLGYALLNTEGPEKAAQRFLDALKRDESRGDALRGLVLAGRRQDAPAWVIQEGVTAARRLEQLEGKDVETLISSETLRPGKESRPRPAVDPATPLDVPWRASVDYLERRISDSSWQPTFIKGVDLVVALPGRFPSEPPTDREVYLQWLQKISDLGANTVRIYSLLPPGFYKALAAHNEQHQDRPLWLIQGIWMELPVEYDFDDVDYVKELHLEISRTVDAVHGNLAIGPRPTRAWGSFDQDVSPWLLSFLIGRNWEPFAIQAFNQKQGHLVTWKGDWLEVSGARPMEAWLARMCDYTIDHEANRYRTIHPISFINGPSLDPLHHPTEATRAEENRFRIELGLRPIPDDLPAWNDDEVALDMTMIASSTSNPAGVFASYQVYPYFPDFMNHEYGSETVSSYEQYLEALKEYHGDQPVLVIEFGIPTSRGIAHIQAGGRHHGGHEEMEQGRLLATMLGEIYRQRYAGGIVFSFMDEWSRSTWNTEPFELPEGRSPMWLNVQSPDQSYGLFRLAPAATSIVIDGQVDDWSAIPQYAID